jgi:hypothetical protein
MDARIDYVKVRITGSEEERGELAAAKEARAAALAERHGIPGKPFERFLQYDRMLRRWYSLFNVWGPLAQYYYDDMAVSEFNRCDRLDIRVSVTNDALDIEEVGEIAKKHAKKKNLKGSSHWGPVASKKNGRDTGGPSVIVGGKGSDRRVSLYMRGNERPAVEGQISGKLLEGCIKQAYDTGYDTDGGFHALLKDILIRELEKLCRDRLLHPLEAFVEDVEISDTGMSDDAYARVYDQMSLFWEFLTPQQQDFFFHEHSVAKPDDEELFPDDDSDSSSFSEVGTYYDAVEAETRQIVDEEDNARMEAELSRIRRDWPYHNLETPD